MLGAMYRDKDGVSAAAVFAEMAADLYSKGSSVRMLMLIIWPYLISQGII